MSAAELKTEINRELELLSDDMLQNVADYIKQIVIKYKIVVNKPAKKSLYDPETNSYLNDETMQAIQDYEEGKDRVVFNSLEDFIAATR